MADITLKNNEGEVVEHVNESVAVGTLNSDIILSEAVHDLRIDWITKGANTTGELQGSIDNVVWTSLQTLSAGLNAAIARPSVPFLRVQLIQSVSPETNVVKGFFQVG